MRPIQFILIPILVLVLLFFTPKLRRLALLQGLFVAGVLVLLLFVIMPDWSTVVANWVGIGRGVDLVIYLGLLMLGVLYLLLLLRVRKLEEKFSNFVRKEAIDRQREDE